ncbi:hypothetical protein Save01_02424 [Streptomyces avermitilis]
MWRNFSRVVARSAYTMLRRVDRAMGWWRTSWGAMSSAFSSSFSDLSWFPSQSHARARSMW